MYAIGLILSLIIGVVLGLVGGGGTILTVPLVHYFFGETMFMATTYSLFVVAVAAGFGFLQRMRHGHVDFRKGFVFVLPSMLTAFSIRLFVMPLFPITFSLSNFELSRDIVITVLLIIVMLYTAFKTLFSKGTFTSGSTSVGTIMGFGILTGLLSGFIGAGGGFIIVPILLRMGLEMKKAVGTSMFIIAIQSSVALTGDLFNKEISQGGEFNWPLLLAITAITVGGVIIGGMFQKKVSSKWLRKVFSFVILLVAIGLIIKMATG
jgi:uncharacterized protein